MSYYYHYTVPWTLIWSLVAVGLVLIVKGVFLVWYCCYYRPRRMATLQAAQRNQFVFAPTNQYGVPPAQYGMQQETPGPMPGKVPGAPPPYDPSFANGGFYGGPEGANAPYPPPSGYGNQAGLVNPPPYSEAFASPSVPPPQSK